jgi:predicted metalloprotease with PDZ domain
MINRSPFLLVALLCATLAAAAGAQTEYRLRFDPAQPEPEWQVEVRLPLRGEETLDFWIPRWTGGAYHLADYGRFVRGLEARDPGGALLPVEHPEPSHFVVAGLDGIEQVVLTYRAGSLSTGTFTNNVIDVEANRIASDHAYVNPVSLFGFVPARAEEPLTLAVELPSSWQAAAVLERDQAGRFQAPSYFRFEDSPLLFSPALLEASFEVDGKPHRVSVHGRSAADVQVIAAGCKRLVEAGSRLMRGLPYDRYHFLYAFAGDGGGSSGLEHSYSTLILIGGQPELDPAQRHSRMFWNVSAHEYFHLWCAERIHVEGLHRPDLTQPFETGTIWVNEGITEYFCRQLLYHAGFLDQEELIASYLGEPIPEGLLGDDSWTDVSRAATEWGDMGDLMQFAVRMYMLGPRTIFALDMHMRRATQGERGVLDLLHHLNQHYVEQDRGFGEDELDEILAAVAGQAGVEFYQQYIDGQAVPDPREYLDVIGYAFEQGRLCSLEGASEAQLKARRDYLSIDGQP